MTGVVESRKEGTVLKRKLLRQNLKIGGRNVRTVRQTGKLKELCDEASRSLIYFGRVTEDHSSGLGLLLSPAAARALGQTPASLLLKTIRLKRFGHVSRMGQERLPKALSQWRPENAKRRRGRCRTRWRDAVERDARLAGIDQDLESMASDRAQWLDMLALLVS